MKKLLVLVLLFVASAAYGEIYTWKGARRTAYYTNSVHEIPARYLSRAMILDVATGKKSPLNAAQPVGQPPAAMPAQPPTAQPPLAQQVPVQGSPPVSPAVAPPAPPAAAPTATAAEPTRAQKRAQARQNRHRSEDE